MNLETIVTNILVAILTPIVTMIDKVLPMNFIMDGHIDELAKATYETLNMLVVSGFFSLLFGILIGVAVVVTRKGGILENRVCEFIFDKIINFFRSVPFVILIPVLLPLTRILSGSGIGLEGAYVPLIFGTVPFFARQIESSLSEVDPGLIEASEAMGCGPFEIIFRVYLKESIPSIARGVAITFISLIGLTAMAGQVGGGGLGNFAIRFGYQGQKVDATWSTVAIILVIVTLIQAIGNYVVKKKSH